MADNRRQSADDAGRAGTPAWMATFSDCMTLLLTFFVLLVSFSSYDEMALRRISGAFDTRPLPSIFDDFIRVDDSLVDETRQHIDRTDKGQEARQPDLIEETRDPAIREPVFDKDAYDDRKTFYIPARRLFLGQGSAMTRQGRDYLASLAEFMRAVPCTVVIGETWHGADGLTSQAARNMDRSCAVVDFLTQEQGLEPQRFYVSGRSTAPQERFRGEPVMVVALLARDIAAASRRHSAR